MLALCFSLARNCLYSWLSNDFIFGSFMEKRLLLKSLWLFGCIFGALVKGRLGDSVHANSDLTAGFIAAGCNFAVYHPGSVNIGGVFGPLPSFW